MGPPLLDLARRDDRVADPELLLAVRLIEPDEHRAPSPSSIVTSRMSIRFRIDWIFCTMPWTVTTVSRWSSPSGVIVAPVVVPRGKMVEQVVDRAEPQPLEELRAPGTDALDELDRSQEQIDQGAWPSGPGSGLRGMRSLVQRQQDPVEREVVVEGGVGERLDGRGDAHLVVEDALQSRGS